MPREEQDTAGSVTQCIQELNSEDRDKRDAAAKQIHERYLPMLLAEVKGKLSRAVARREGVSDIVQETFVAVLCNPDSFELRNRSSLRGLLLDIVKKRKSDAVRRQTREKRSVVCEEDGDFCLSEHASIGRTPIPAEKAKRKYRSSSPVSGGMEPQMPGQTIRDHSYGSAQEEVAVAIEMLEGLSDVLQQVALLELLMFKDEEIAQSMGCKERTVRRYVEKIRGKWRGYLAGNTLEEQT